jgi:hypothetical protein
MKPSNSELQSQIDFLCKRKPTKNQMKPSNSKLQSQIDFCAKANQPEIN